ncbi:hypothetical protein BDF14DRAFT_1745401 [Spinellus fusiger]|nr:hypothetical protein BDF14DRAFT_1745401 [Spinellus fusiger]
MRTLLVFIFALFMAGLVPAELQKRAAPNNPAPNNPAPNNPAPNNPAPNNTPATSVTTGAAPTGAPVNNNPGNGSVVAPNTAIPAGAAGASASIAALPVTGSWGPSIFPGYASIIAPTGSKSIKPLFRIASNENVTIVWGYTMLMVRPVSITLAAVGPQSATLPIATVDGGVTSVVWNLGNVSPATPLMNGFYKIQIYDQRGISAIPQPGWLQPCTTLTIAMYSPETYVPLTDSSYCPTCFYSAARHLKDTFGPLGIAMGVAGLTSMLFIYGL